MDHGHLRHADDPGVCGADVAGGAYVAARGLGVGHRGILSVGNPGSADPLVAGLFGVGQSGAGADFGRNGGNSGSGHGGQCCGLFGVSGLCAVGICHLSGSLFLGMCESWTGPEGFQSHGLGGSGIRDF